MLQLAAYTLKRDEGITFLTKRTQEFGITLGGSQVIMAAT